MSFYHYYEAPGFKSSMITTDKEPALEAGLKEVLIIVLHTGNLNS